MEQQEKITAIYCRTAQADPAAIEAQRETLLRYAAERGFGNIEIYEDDGYSGRDTTRPAFARINALIACGRVARVLAVDIARLGRNAAEVLPWARTARDMGAEVITLDMGPSTLPERFAAWLAGPTGGPFIFQEYNAHFTVIRVAKNADFDYLYSQRNYGEVGLERGEKFEFADLLQARRQGLRRAV